MRPSTDAGGEPSEFAAEVLRNLLRRIENENTIANPAEWRYAFLISHAWTDGPMMYLVYKAPPSDITWGLVRDTRESLIDPDPWPDVDEAVTYYYILDLEEGCATEYPRGPGIILWCGDPLHTDLPERPSDIPDEYRYTPPPVTSSAKHDREQEQRVVSEPRRYADPREPNSLFNPGEPGQ
jgi:hypothetical protein